MSDNGFRFGDWQIDTDSNTLRQGTTASQVEPKAMDVLRYLCRHPGAVIPPEELLQACWGNAELGDNPIHKAITQLRRALGDSASEPRYIETVRKRGYRAIAPVIATEDALEGSWQQGSPFRGLESFQESHAAIFFGRMQATAQLRELVLDQASSGCAMSLVLGPSGSGKTSLVRAGLLPGLMAARTGSGEPVALACTLYMDCADLADGNLFQALAAVLIDAEIDGKLLFSGENAEELGRWLESSDAAAIAGRLAEVSGRIKIGLFVDRLEAIFRAPGVTDEIRSRFIAVLEHLACSKAVLVMLACRNDFYPEVIALPLLMALKSRGGHFDLNPPDGAEIAQMVRMPAKAAGLKFEQDAATGTSLDDVLCDAARGSPDTLPLLQYCLNELYRQRGEDGTLRFEVFRQLGGIEGAIAVRAEQVVTGLSSGQTAALPHLLSLIVDVAEEQSAVTARRAAWSTLQSSEARELAQALVEARLFVSELAADVSSFGMAHEALLRRWPRVSEWIELHRHALQLRSRINQDAEKWVAAGKPRDLLLPAGIRINQARDLLQFKSFSLSPEQISYINHSQRRVKLAERVRLMVTILIGILAVAAALLGFTAYRAQQTAELRRVEAENLVGYMLGEFSEKLRPIGKLELLDDISSKALVYFVAPSTDTNTPATLIQRAKALQVIAEVSIARAQPQRALEALSAAHTILATSSQLQSIDFLKVSGANAFWLGQLKLNGNQLNEAKHFFTEYLEFSNKLVSISPDNVDGWIEKSYAYSSLGTLSLKLNNKNVAHEQFKMAMELKHKALEKRPKDTTLSASLANNYSWMAEFHIDSGRPKKSLEYYHQQEKLLVQIHKENPTDFSWTYQLANALGRQGEVYGFIGNGSEALKKLEQAESLLITIIEKDNTNRSWQATLYNVQLKLIEAGAHDSNLPNKIRRLSILSDNLNELRKIEPTRANITILGLMAQQDLVSALLLGHRNLEAASLLATNMGQLNNLPEKIQSDINVINLRANSFILESNIAAANLNSNSVNRSCMSALKILEPIANTTYNYRILSTLSRSYYCSGNKTAYELQLERLKTMGYSGKYHPSTPEHSTN